MPRSRPGWPPRGSRPGPLMWESYLTDPGDEPDPATWRTLIVWPTA